MDVGRVLRTYQRVCLGFVGLGVALALAGATPLFGWWRGAVAHDLFGAARLPPDVTRLARLTDAILGASIVGKWLTAWWLARGPLAAGHTWAWRASVAALALWWLVDSGVSLAVGAPANVVLVNGAPLVCAGSLLAMLRRHRAPTAPVPRARPRGWWALELVCWANVGLGLMVAVAPRWGGFAAWCAGLDRWVGAPASPEADLWLRFVAGPIGGTIAAHFLLLGWAARRAPGAAWVRRAVVTSVLAWCALDSALSVALGAWFNLAYVNLPCVVVVLVATAVARPGVTAAGPATVALCVAGGGAPPPAGVAIDLAVDAGVVDVFDAGAGAPDGPAATSSEPPS